MVRRFLLVIVMIFFSPFLVLAATLTVSPVVGDGQFTTIQACANAANAGDTCLVKQGTYDEYVIIPKSGTKTDLITFTTQGTVKVPGFAVNGKDYIRIKGFEITNQGLTKSAGPGYSYSSIYVKASTGTEILNNYIHHTQGGCIRLHESANPQKIIIRDNTIAYCNYPGNGASAMAIQADETLIEGNDMSHVDNFIALAGSKNVVRRNIMHDSFLSEWPTPSDLHQDGIESSCSANYYPSPLRKALIEDNLMYNVPDTDTHFLLLRDTQKCGASDIIIRHNTVRNIGSCFMVSSDNFPNIRVYNNTLANLQMAIAPNKEWADVSFTANTPNAKLMNNIFYNDVRAGGYVYTVDVGSKPGFYASNNLAFNTDCTTNCTWGWNGYNMIQTEPNVVLNKDPLFTAVDDLSLQASSPAIDKGGALTQVAAADTGSGTSLLVMEAGFFQDGWAQTSPDTIAVGTVQNTVQIQSISTANVGISTTTPHAEIILASAITRKSGDKVWLFKNSSSRQVIEGLGPDIGASEYKSKTIFYGDVTGDGSVGVFDAALTAQFAVGLVTMNVQQLKAADVSGDGQVTLYDAALIAQKAVGLIGKFPVEP